MKKINATFVQKLGHGRILLKWILICYNLNSWLYTEKNSKEYSRFARRNQHLSLKYTEFSCSLFCSRNLQTILEHVIDLLHNGNCSYIIISESGMCTN